MNRQKNKRIGLILVVWFIALSLVYLVYIKAKLLLNF